MIFAVTSQRRKEIAQEKDLRVRKGGLPPPVTEFRHSTRGGKPPFPTLRFQVLNVNNLMRN
jgi:hypothetical protein